ncbi:DUF2795 domain-containing protein [Rickettsiales endosymbiont of Stachyamoeba lipophora]|uniref:DUF2795 domain-containing protein n=1 Tax=Rickettsiales endosymbiont of Stachyamoeba lipophora TaxID=2486578 RepID=UPI000F65108D|nr:DUF2795 domain-containing protein [Rickettsiales endosymbiont of Stachyamoeba lipophora]AZL16301.1 DUF2795 domain-containing protein [Rickettsiales endosymbiont of Stachyamoeba lipophora]
MVQDKKQGTHSRDSQQGEHKVNAAEIERYLKGIHYPANKNDLIDQAKKNNAPKDILNELQAFDDHQYASPIDVSKEFSRHH